jgi:hypothetical protein
LVRASLKLFESCPLVTVDLFWVLDACGELMEESPRFVGEFERTSRRLFDDAVDELQRQQDPARLAREDMARLGKDMKRIEAAEPKARWAESRAGGGTDAPARTPGGRGLAQDAVPAAALPRAERVRARGHGRRRGGDQGPHGQACDQQGTWGRRRRCDAADGAKQRSECSAGPECGQPCKYSLVTGAFDTDLPCASRRVGCVASKIGRHDPLHLNKEVGGRAREASGD